MKRRLKWLIPLCIIAALVVSFFAYTESYYRAGDTALEVLVSGDKVSVSKTDYGWFFDGPSGEDLLVFYPGGKVEETAYAPLLHQLAEKGMDVCLLKVPFRLAVLDADKADDVFALYDHENRYVGGHSLGGAIAANYASQQGDELKGVILLAAYPTKPLDDHLMVISIYGSEDEVLNNDKVLEGHKYVTGRYVEYVIEGGNHAQFGNYGVQKGDGTASISADYQQEQTVDIIIQSIE